MKTLRPLHFFLVVVLTLAVWSVTAGAGQGRRDELVGGGLKRSLRTQGRGAKPEAYDERVLGLGEFVERLRQEEELRERLPLRLSIEELVRRVPCPIAPCDARA